MSLAAHGELHRVSNFFSSLFERKKASNVDSVVLSCKYSVTSLILSQYFFCKVSIEFFISCFISSCTQAELKVVEGEKHINKKIEFCPQLTFDTQFGTFGNFLIILKKLANQFDVS
jgi:hypothetical protein